MAARMFLRFFKSDRFCVMDMCWGGEINKLFIAKFGFKCIVIRSNGHLMGSMKCVITWFIYFMHRWGTYMCICRSWAGETWLWDGIGEVSNCGSPFSDLLVIKLSGQVEDNMEEVRIKSHVELELLEWQGDCKLVRLSTSLIWITIYGTIWRLSQVILCVGML